ncbi:hypothetical protein BIY24_05060 [Halobacteriovorax marinus]|uniref:hypothetical protein n=1 Tax=Halobacteriovorax marinus TaxID=97084 RepID=UPI000BC2FF63|nr:hypothetical protein [Halobacteriovorax marinus]ATH07326.1 hypothetical protein BIY24_05060 [Halobacteriovorax marinus]
MLKDSWSKKVGRIKFLIMGYLIPATIPMIPILISVQFTYGDLSVPITSITKDFSFVLNGNQTAAEMRGLNDGITQTVFIFCAILFFISILASAYLSLLFQVRRIRDIFGVFKYRYLIILGPLMLNPYTSIGVVLFYTLVPGKKMKVAKAIE